LILLPSNIWYFQINLNRGRCLTSTPFRLKVKWFYFQKSVILFTLLLLRKEPSKVDKLSFCETYAEAQVLLFDSRLKRPRVLVSTKDRWLNELKPLGTLWDEETTQRGKSLKHTAKFKTYNKLRKMIKVTPPVLLRHQYPHKPLQRFSIYCHRTNSGQLQIT